MRFGEFLLKNKYLGARQIERALVHHQKHKTPLGNSLVALRILPESVVYELLAKHLSLPYLDLSKLPAEDWVQIPKSLSEFSWKAHRMICLGTRKVNGKARLLVATDSPFNYKALDEIRFRAGLPVYVVMTSPKKLEAVLEVRGASDHDRSIAEFSSFFDRYDENSDASQFSAAYSKFSSKK